MIETDLATRATEESVVVVFPAGLPGFHDAHRFELAPWGPEDTSFMLLSGIDDPDVGFVVVPPWVFYPGYEFDLDDGVAERLGLREPEDAMVLCVVTLRERPEDATVNLLGPIVVNRHTLDAAQVVLAASGYGVAAPIGATA